MQAFLRASLKKESEHRGPVRLARSAVRALQGRPRTTEEALATLPYKPEEISGFWLKVYLLSPGIVLVKRLPV